MQALVDQVDQLLATLPARPTGPAAGAFANTHYLPFFVALKQKDFVEPFVYWASQRAPVPGVVVSRLVRMLISFDIDRPQEALEISRA